MHKYDHYWAQTSHNGIVKQYLKSVPIDTFMALTHGQTITTSITSDFDSQNYDHNLPALLLFTGYLTCQKQLSPDCYELFLPNKEPKKFIQELLISGLKKREEVMGQRF